MSDTTAERTPKTADEKLADALAQLQAPAKVEKSLEQIQREEATAHVQTVLAGALAQLDTAAYRGAGKDAIAKAASSLTRALANAKAAVKATDAADLVNLPGVSAGDETGPAVLAD